MAQAFCRSKDADQVANIVQTDFIGPIAQTWKDDIKDHTDHQEGNRPNWLKGDDKETEDWKTGQGYVEGQTCIMLARIYDNATRHVVVLLAQLVENDLDLEPQIRMLFKEGF